MRRIAAATLGFTLSIAISASAFAESVEIDGDMLERDVRILSHDNMEGREAGTRGYARAAGYVAGRYAAIGLEPAGDDGTYFQNVPLLSYQIADEGNGVTMVSTGGEIPLTIFEDFYITPNPTVASGEIEGELVFIGYGIDMPGRNDFEGIDLEGKIAVRLSGAPTDINTEERAHYRSTLAKRLSDRGAIGMVLVWTPQLEDRNGWDRTVEHARHRTNMTWVQPDGRPYLEAPNVMASVVLSPDQSRALLAGQEFGYDEMAAAELTPSAQMPSFELGKSARISFASTSSRIESPNVIGMLPGSDPEVADEYVVLTGHLDHIGIRPTEDEGDDEIYNGAMDNAVGIASILEVARLLTANPPRRPTLFISLAAEEKGLLGSSYNAVNPTVPREHVVANVNLDMPILTYDFSDMVAFGAERSNLYPHVVAAAEENGVILSPDPMPEEGLFVRSDQYSYVLAGVPASYLDIGFGNGGEPHHRDFLNNHYHEASDHIEHVDFEALERFVAVNYSSARNIANMAERPAWNEGDFFGELYAESLEE